MSAWHSKPMRLGLAVFAAAMAGLAAWAFMNYGASLIAVAVAAIAIACVAALFYAWWLGWRAAKPIEQAGRTAARREP